MRSRCLDYQEFDYLSIFYPSLFTFVFIFFANNPETEYNIKRLRRSLCTYSEYNLSSSFLSESTNTCCSVNLDKCRGKFTFAIQPVQHSCFRHELCKPCLSALLLNLAKER